MSGKKRHVIVNESDDDEQQDHCQLLREVNSLSKTFKNYKNVEVQTFTDSFKKFVCSQRPSDPRNVYFVGLIAYELQRIPEEKRDYIPLILNIIRELRGAPQLSEIMKNVPKITDGIDSDNYTHPSLPLNVESNVIEKKKPDYKFDDEQTRCDIRSSSPPVITRPSSPSILSWTYMYKKKLRRTSNENNDVKAENKEIQTNEAEIIDAMVYRRYKNNRISYTTETLPDIDFHDEYPVDERNKDVARLIVFELERMPDECRSNVYPQILNFINLVSGDNSHINQVVTFAPNTSHFKIGTQSDNIEFPLNINFEDV